MPRPYWVGTNAAALAQHRALLAEHVRATGDDFFELEWLAAPRWPSRRPGYEYHVGPAAPMVG